jgi:acetyltransferase
MTARRIAKLLAPSSVVLIGASDTPGTLGDVVRRNLTAAAFPGPVHYVNLRHDSVAGQPVYRSVSDLPAAPDLAVIVTPAATVPDLVSECGRLGVSGAVIVSTGFGEDGRAGHELGALLASRAHEHGLRFLGPGSLGVIRGDLRLNASCGPQPTLPGRLALVSQSGAICAAILDWAQSRRIGFSTVISTGLGSDVSLGEILDFLARDPATDSIMLYLHAVGDARRFMSALRAVARVKPVVVMRAGRRAEKPEPDAAFHAGALVGEDDVFDAAMRRAGVLRIRDFAELYTAAATLGAGVRVSARRLAIVSNARATGAIAEDRAEERWLPMAQLGSDSLARLGALPMSGDGPGNPVYLRADAEAAHYAEAVEVCMRDPGVDVVLALLVPHALAEPDVIARSLLEVSAAHRKPLFTSWMGGEGVEASRKRFAAAGVPSYTRPEVAVDGIAALSLFAANQQQLLQVPAPLQRETEPDRATAQAIIDAALANGQEWLDPADSKAVLAAFGVPVVQSLPARSAEQAVAVARSVGLPVVMKILSPDIAHKTDVGGVRLGLPDVQSVRSSYAAMMRDVARARPDAQLEGVLIEPLYRRRHARELMIGVVRDPEFGPAIIFGLGGLLVEVICDRAVALPPLNAFLAGDLVRRTRASAAMQPLRGAPAADEEAVVDILLRVSDVVCELPNVAAMDLNPVIVTDSGAVVLDARIGIVSRAASARPYDHMAIHPYPSALERKLELSGGVSVTLRPIRPEDAAIEHAFVHGLSEQSKFLRFMFGLKDLTPAMLSRFTQVDYDREIALIALIDTPDGEQQIGVARYTVLPDEQTCEFAIVVADAWQGKGLARRLLAQLADTARQRGLLTMTGVTMRENQRMIELSRSLGFQTGTDKDDPDLVQMTLDLQRPPAPTAPA